MLAIITLSLTTSADAQATYPSEFDMEYCLGPTCLKQRFSCPHFQMKTWSYYQKKTFRPPLKEAWFLLGLPKDYRSDLTQQCPGGMVISAIITAQTTLYTNPKRAEQYYTAAMQLLAQELNEVHRNVAIDSWPLELAQNEFYQTKGFLEEMDVKRKNEIQKQSIRNSQKPVESTNGNQLQQDSSMSNQNLNMAQSLDVVVVRCKESLDWIMEDVRVNSKVLEKLRIFIYEKCGENEDILGKLDHPNVLQQRYNFTETGSLALTQYSAGVYVISLSDADDIIKGKRTRRDECTAYAGHLDKVVFKRWFRPIITFSSLNANGGNLNNITSQSDLEAVKTELVKRAIESEIKSKLPQEDFIAADYTLYVHGDALKHWGQFQYGYLNLILASISAGRLTTGFLHLSTPRLVAVSTPCQDHVFEYVMARPRQKLLNTYCCAQFLVSRETMQSIPNQRVERLTRIVDGSIPDLCERVGPTYERYPGERLAYCYSLEFMWHAILTPDDDGRLSEDEDEPLRSENPRVPFFLRWKDTEHVMPSWKNEDLYHLMRYEYLNHDYLEKLKPLLGSSKQANDNVNETLEKT